MNASWWLHPVCTAITHWQESGENPLVFCYLIIWGFVVSMRTPRTKTAPSTERLKPACWIPSSTFSVHSTTQRDFAN